MIIAIIVIFYRSTQSPLIIWIFKIPSHHRVVICFIKYKCYVVLVTYVNQALINVKQYFSCASFFSSQMEIEYTNAYSYSLKEKLLINHSQRW